MIKTDDDSIFYRLHSTSQISEQIFKYIKPSIEGKEIVVLQVEIYKDLKLDMLIEFKYVKEK